jgi:hypothetical protein
MAAIQHQGQIYNVLDLELLATDESLHVSAPDGAVMLAEANPLVIPRETADESQIPFLLLEIAGEHYAVRNSAIAELNVPGPVTPMPGSPEWIAGLIDLRGSPIVAISTASLLGRPTAGGRHDRDIGGSGINHPGHPARSLRAVA